MRRIKMVQVKDVPKEEFVRIAKENGLDSVTDAEWERNAKDRQWSISTAMNRIRNDRKSCFKWTDRDKVVREAYTNEWELISRKIKERDRECVVCGSKELIATHHIISVFNEINKYERNELWNLITLCRECHELIHHSSKYRKPTPRRTSTITRYAEYVNSRNERIHIHIYNNIKILIFLNTSCGWKRVDFLCTLLPKDYTEKVIRDLTERDHKKQTQAVLY